MNVSRNVPMTPAYLQVKEFVQQHISSGEWRPGAPVPSRPR